ncbi:MAG: AsmA family protein [Alphaproteobacteria bacterium]|jgi:uncharacterized protein involved in outer membrane biogenesis|nr:AsmA family protein [Alphaproteobacteria bacterium]MBP9876966.1 AsmA family protein [Alphaproteobacteria bacterium]
MKNKASPILILTLIFLLAIVGVSIRFLTKLDKETLKQTLIDHAKVETGLDLMIGGDLILTYYPLGIELNDVTLRKTIDNQQDVPAFLTVSKMKAEFDIVSFLTGKIVVDDLVLQDGSLSLVMGKNEERNWDIEPAVFDKSESEAFDLAVENITIENMVFSFEDQKKGLSKKIGISNAEMAAYDGEALTLSLVGSFESAPLIVNYQGPYPTHYFSDKAKAEPILLKVRYAGNTLELNGKTGSLLNYEESFPVLDLKAIILGGKLSALNPLLMTSLPDVGPYELNFEIESDPDLVQIDKMILKIRQSEFTGSIDVFLKNQPKYDVSLKIKALNLDDFKGGDKTSTSGLFDQLIPYLKNMDGEADIALKSFGAYPGTVDNIYATIEQKNNVLTVSEVKGKLFGGDLSGFASLNFQKEPHLNWDLMVKNAKVGMILKDEGVESLAQIEMKASSKLSGPDSFINQMNGSLVIKAGPGSIPKLDLDFLRSEVLSFLFPAEAAKQSTALNCLVADFDIRKGVMGTNYALLDTQDYTLFGMGKVHLLKETVNFIIEPKAKHFEILSFKTPFHVKGSYDDLKASPVKMALAEKGAEIGISVGLGGPFGLISSFMSLGELDKDPCTKAMRGEYKKQSVFDQKTQSLPQRFKDKMSNDVKDLFNSLFQ